MQDVPLNEAAQLAGDWLLTWVGFGTLVGLVAKAIMPGRDPGGAVATLLMGVGGAVIGCGILSYFYDGQRVSPLTPLGFCLAVGGAFVLLVFYRLLGGYWFVEGDAVLHPRGAGRVRRRRRRRPSFADVHGYDD